MWSTRSRTTGREEYNVTSPLLARCHEMQHRSVETNAAPVSRVVHYITKRGVTYSIVLQ